MKRAAQRVGIAVATAATTMAVVQTGWERMDRRRHQPPGELVQRPGTRKYWHLLRRGTGEPTVLVIPALGTAAIEWTRVLDALPKHTDASVFVLDKAGLGWSSSAPLHPLLRSPNVLANELDMIIPVVAHDGPVVMVGHSTGGVVARLWAARNPEYAAGLVLVDSSHEEQNTVLPGWTWPQVLPRLVAELASPLPLTRMYALLPKRDWPVPARWRAAWLAGQHRRCSRTAGVQEELGWTSRSDPGQARDLGDLPLAVVIGGQRDGHDECEQASWHRFQTDLLSRSTRSWQVDAQHCGHHINRDDPDLVARAIVETIGETVR